MSVTHRSIEREVKLSMDPGQALPDLRGVVAATVRLPEQHTRALYFDTSDLRLWHQGVTLRHRSGEDPGEGIWTLKVPAAGEATTLDRTELSWPGAPDTVPEEAIRITRGIVRRSPLSRVAELVAVRRRLELRGEDGSPYGEIDDDTVTVVLGNGRSRRFRQVEVELGPRGERVVGDVVATLRRAGARKDGEPKLGKALRFAGQDGGADAPMVLHARSSMADVVVASLRRGLDLLVDHDIGLRLDAIDPAPRDIHQARVATRRLRSDLKLLVGELDPVWVAHTRDELQWLGGVLGQVRDADVLAGSLSTAGSVAEAGGTLELRVALDEDRRTAARAVAAALAEERYLTLLDRLHSAALHPPLRRAHGSRKKGKHNRRGGRGSDRPARTVLPRLVRKRLRGLATMVRAAGRHPTDRQLHKIRIRSKQLRYAAEAATPVLGKPARRVANAAESVQTVLGDHHDAVAAEQWLRRQALAGTRSAAFSAGLLVAGEQRRQTKLRRAWRSVWVELDPKKLGRSLG